MVPQLVRENSRVRAAGTGAVDLECAEGDLVDPAWLAQPAGRDRGRGEMYKAIIVEDDREAADTLRSHLDRFGADAGVEFSVEVLTSALELLEGPRRACDIYFLDIGLPGINGMEAAQIIRQTDDVTPIVFVTDLAQYAVRGYSVDALDFMVKPVTYQDFALRMGRALRVMARNDGARVTLPTASGLRVIAQRDVIFVEIIKHDLYWHVVGESKPLRMRGSLKAVEAELPPERFCRIAAGYIVNMAHIARVTGTDVTMSDGTALAISRSRKAEAMTAFSRFAGGSI